MGASAASARFAGRRRLLVFIGLGLTVSGLPAALAAGDSSAPWAHAGAPADAAAPPAAGIPAVASGPGTEPERVVVELSAPASPGEEAEIASSVGGKVVDLGRPEAFGVETPAGGADAAQRKLRTHHKVKKTRRDPRFRAAEVIPNEPCFAGCTLSFDGGTTGRQFSQSELITVGAKEAWAVTKGDPNTLVAVLDTDVDDGATDLQGKVIMGPNLSGDDAPDKAGHGTAVAGLIAAIPDNGVGIAGLGWSTRVLSVRVLDRKGSGFASKIAQGVRYAADYPGVRIINLSLQQDAGDASQFSSDMAEAIAYAQQRGVLVVAASGNDGRTSPTYPASFDGVLSVGAVDHADATAPFSNRGRWVDIAAPGVENLTLAPNCDCWTTPSGTSFAAPIVSAAAALVMAANPRLTAGEVAAQLMATAAPVPGSGTDFLSGRVDVGKAVTAPIPATPVVPDPALSSAPPDTTAASPALARAPSSRPAGYWLTAADGGVFAFGTAGFFGSTGNLRLNKPIVGMTGTDSGNGYWMTASDGGVFAFGDAPFHGSTGAMRLNQPIVTMTPTPSGRGYWLIASDGGVFAFGDAGFFGSTGNLRLNRPIVSMAATPSGQGYWLVASDGGIFSFGDARFLGSVGNVALARPVVAMASTPTGDGYWLVSADGGIFSFGTARYQGAVSGKGVGDIVAIGVAEGGSGYWLAGADGTVYRFGDVPFLGDLGRAPLNRPIVSLAVR